MQGQAIDDNAVAVFKKDYGFFGIAVGDGDVAQGQAGTIEYADRFDWASVFDDADVFDDDVSCVGYFQRFTALTGCYIADCEVGMLLFGVVGPDGVFAVEGVDVFDENVGVGLSASAVVLDIERAGKPSKQIYRIR